MAIKECSLYKFLIGGQTIKTTPKDVKARKWAQRISSVANHDTTRTLTIDLSVARVLVTGHANTAALRGMYIIATDGTVHAVMPASGLTVSVTITAGVATLSIQNTAAGSSNARFVVI